MSDVYLTRVEPGQNMARYYRMSLQPTLFGEWALVREWGRIGCGGQVTTVAYLNEADAGKAKERLAAAKVKKGYRIC